MARSHEITRMLHRWRDGDREALDRLLPIVYDELYRQASRYLRRERAENSFQTVDLINETYIKLVDQPNLDPKNRLHFFAISANLMRQVLVDHARAKHRKKRGGDKVKLPLKEELIGSDNTNGPDLLALDEAMERLQELDERQVRVVELRYFSGLTLEETAEALGISSTTVSEDWRMARAWLHRELTR